MFSSAQAEAGPACRHIFQSENQIILDGRARLYEVGPGGVRGRFRLVNAAAVKLLITQNADMVNMYLAYLLRTGQVNEWFESLLRLEWYRTEPQNAKFPDRFDIDRKDISWNAFPHILARWGVISLKQRKRLFRRNLPWENDKSLARHYKKHGFSEFGAQSEAQYHQMANLFLRGYASMEIVMRRTDGSLVKYDPGSYEVAIVSSVGEIMTYYKLTEKYREEGWSSDYVGRVILDER